MVRSEIKPIKKDGIYQYECSRCKVPIKASSEGQCKMNYELHKIGCKK